MKREEDSAGSSRAATILNVNLQHLSISASSAPKKAVPENWWKEYRRKKRNLSVAPGILTANLLQTQSLSKAPVQPVVHPPFFLSGKKPAVFVRTVDGH